MGMAELLSISEVAQITGLHEITIRRYVRAGKLEAVRVGRRIRVRREALDTLMTPIQPDPTRESAPESGERLGEGTAAYEVTSSGKGTALTQALIGGVALRLVQLPPDDITLGLRTK